MSLLIPNFDFSNIRKTRQISNNRKAYHSELKDKDYVNSEAIKRVYDQFASEFGLSEKELKEEIASNDHLCYALAMYCSVAASRQGPKDEIWHLDEIANNLSSHLKHFEMRRCSKDEYVPIKETGEVFDRKVIKELGIGEADHLRSFDFCGTHDGVDFLGFAKICCGKHGGVQKFAFEEAVSLIEWLNKFGKSEKEYFLLLDGNYFSDDMFKELRRKVSDKKEIHVVNYKEFYAYFLEKTTNERY
jgi:hypothetical protein